MFFNDDEDKDNDNQLLVATEEVKQNPFDKFIKEIKSEKSKFPLAEAALKNSILNGVEVEPPMSKRAKKRLKKIEKSKSTGPSHFNFKSHELDEKNKIALNLIRMRSALEPNRFYKKAPKRKYPKFFQIGTFVESKKSLADSLLEEVNAKKHQLEKFKKISKSKSKSKRKSGQNQKTPWS